MRNSIMSGRCDPNDPIKQMQTFQHKKAYFYLSISCNREII